MTVANGQSDAAQSVITVEQNGYRIPDLTMKDLLECIPKHCFQRSAVRSSLYIVYDLFLIYCIYNVTIFADSYISKEYLSLPSPYIYSFLRFSLWALYGFVTGLVMTGLWVIAHECGHQAFSESKLLNNVVGWILHSALGVPYHSWRITHAKHHASTGHMLLDQVFVPKTRTQLGLPAFDPTKEDLYGASVTEEIKQELREALGDSPIGASLGVASYLIFGWPLYLMKNASGQHRYPEGTNHFTTGAPLFAPHQTGQILISDIGVVIWLLGVIAFAYYRGFNEIFRTYLVPYLWVNHWLVLITFLQHTDPLLPHYRPPEFTFSRGALATLDRQLLGDLGSWGAAIGAHITHGISETHVLHHVSSKIPHYHAWEATDALRERLARAGIKLEGAPGGWREMYRVFKECKFVEDIGDIVFYKNAHGLAATKAIMPDRDSNISDSGIELDKSE